MSRYTLFQKENAVAVDRVARTVDLSALDPAINVVQFDTARGRGWVEWDTVEVTLPDGEIERRRQPNTPIDAAFFEANYRAYITAWETGGPPPVTPELDARLRLDEEERLQAKLDTALIALCDATPAARVAWARANFPSMTLAEQNRLGMLLNMVAIALRPLVRR